MEHVLPPETVSRGVRLGRSLSSASEHHGDLNGRAPKHGSAPRPLSCRDTGAFTPSALDVRTELGDGRLASQDSPRPDWLPVIKRPRGLTRNRSRSPLRRERGDGAPSSSEIAFFSGRTFPTVGVAHGEKCRRCLETVDSERCVPSRPPPPVGRGRTVLATETPEPAPIGVGAPPCP